MDTRDEEQIRRELSFGETMTNTRMSRRQFLQAVAAGATVASLPGWLQAAAAAPLGPDEGVLVLIEMGGGMDGLDTVVPYGDSNYYGLRNTIAVPANQALSIGPGVGLNPKLPKIKAKWDAGNLAVIRGVGYPNPDLSHFSSMAYWMMGKLSVPTVPTGWIGRYLDSFATNELNSVTVGNAVPLTLAGKNTNACSVPEVKDQLFGATVGDDTDQRLFDALKSFGATSRGAGTLLDKYASCEKAGMDVAQQLGAIYPPPVDDDSLKRQLDMAARLINANIGIRVLNVSIDGFDTHTDQRANQDELLTALDNAVDAFFNVLSPSFASRVTIMTFSEFGRRPEENGDHGTDHGTASTLMVIGKNVKGGVYGDAPSLTSFDDDGNLKATVDFRSVYATILDQWLHADSQSILGATFDKFDLFVPNTSGSPTPLPGITPALPAPPSGAVLASDPRVYRIITTDGGVYNYGTAPDKGSATNTGSPVVAIATTPTKQGYWITRANGDVQAFGDAQNKGSMSGQRLNKPIVGMAATNTGNGYWLLGADGGVFSFGDAAFYGSTGSIKLNQPVVGMAAPPNGGGYWFVASDGGIFAYGPGAGFYGSMGGTRLNKPVVGMAATPSGKGYWLVASDGGVFCFGDAPFWGSTGSIKLNQPVVGMSATPSGKGYRFVAADGGVFCFGDATFEGSLGASGTAHVAGMA